MEIRKERIKQLEEEFNASQNDYMEFYRRTFNIIEVNCMEIYI